MLDDIDEDSQLIDLNSLYVNGILSYIITIK